MKRLLPWIRHWDSVHMPYRPRPDHLVVESDVRCICPWDHIDLCIDTVDDCPEHGVDSGSDRASEEGS